MTRINLIKPQWLLDQHLMAEYRELPMVMASLRRSLKSKNGLVIPPTYRMNSGHVPFFYDKKDFLMMRWEVLIKELRRRKFLISPENRIVDFTVFDNVECVEWKPNMKDMLINLDRILLRVSEKPDFYLYKGKGMTYKTYCTKILERI